jgi:hypothetical protein
MALRPAGDITLLLSAAKDGDEDGNEQPGHTLQPTAPVNEAYLRLLGKARRSWQRRAHFFAVGRRFMDPILIDHAPGRPSAKARRRHSIRVCPQEPLAKSALSDPFIGLISVPASTSSQQEAPVAASAAAVAALNHRAGVPCLVAPNASVAGMGIRRRGAPVTLGSRQLHTGPPRPRRPLPPLVLEVTTNLSISAHGALAPKRDGSVVFGAAAHTCPQWAVQKALTELSRVVYWKERIAPDPHLADWFCTAHTGAPDFGWLLPHGETEFPTGWRLPAKDAVAQCASAFGTPASLAIGWISLAPKQAFGSHEPLLPD